MLWKGRASHDFVFRQKETVGATPGERRSKGWLLDLVRSVCRRAGTHVVSVHGLRDTYASLRRELYGETVEDIGVRLGHGRKDGGKTAEQHYIGSLRTDEALELPPARQSEPVATWPPIVGE